MFRRLVLASAAGAVTACATLADTGGGDQNLPNARVGPFREIADEELGGGRSAPNTLQDEGGYTRDLSVVDVDGDSSTLEAWGYAARALPAGEDTDPGSPPNAIVRHVALDGRTFADDPVIVLEPAEAWEGTTVGAPSALRVGAETWLYYTAEGGIGLAVSADGTSFERRGTSAVLDAAGATWEKGAPRNPGVVRLPDGTFQMFYDAPTSAGPAVGEARSADGLSWSRVGQAPVLAPEATIDAAGAEAPWPLVGESAEGRTLEYLYYGATDADGRATVAIAAREGLSGSFQRGTGPVFGASGSLGPTQPCVVRYPEYTLLFVTQLAGTLSSLEYPAVAVGVAPATVTLPPPEPP